MAYHSILLALVCFLNFHILVRTYETYIVHLELPQNSPALAGDELDNWYKTFLPSTLPDSHLIHTYDIIFKGFAARLLPEHVKEMEKIPGFVSAHPEQIFQLDTTYSPSFLGLTRNTGLWRDTNYGKGLIIGVLDTGITPNHPSFGASDVDRPPARWRGICQFTRPATCNNKLIGARFYAGGDGTPLDRTGHGTHVAGIAAGNFVNGANVFGSASGTAAGVAPLAHIASYKVCSPICGEAAILRGMEDAIRDGVDILSLSFGNDNVPYHSANLAVGAFRAMQNNIFVSAAGGNYGPTVGSVRNTAPWILTVGSSSLDRKLRATAVLGRNNTRLLGESTNQPTNFPTAQQNLIFPGLSSTNNNTQFCVPEALASFNLTDRIVVCRIGGRITVEAKGQAVKGRGGIAMIVTNSQLQGFTTISESYPLPATRVSYNDFRIIREYIRSTTPSSTAAMTFQGTILRDRIVPSPAIPYSSGRGPNRISPGILKPDIIGPGVNILSAWHVNVEGRPSSTSNFNIQTGTSMACPHLSGAAALIKRQRPNWSPAMIKSAMMTTAYQLSLGSRNQITDQTGSAASVHAMGAGHVDILRAINPGLLFNLGEEQYTLYLCGLRYTNAQVSFIVGRNVNCSRIGSIDEQDLNLPSFSIPNLASRARTYSRIAINVGQNRSIYDLQVTQFPGLSVTVQPNRLQFAQFEQRRSFDVTFTRLRNATSGQVFEGAITWVSGTFNVRIPFYVRAT